MAHQSALRIVLLSSLAAVTLMLAAVTDTGPASAGGGGCHGAPTKEATGTRIELTRNCFSPTVLNIEPGDTVTFENLDVTPHDIAGVAGLWGVNGSPLAHGATASITFTEPGLYPYSCYLHYGMTGVISVGDSRSAAGQNPGALTVSRVPAAAPETAPLAADAASPSDSGGLSPEWAAAGALAAGALLVSGIVTVRWRRSR